VTRITRSLKDRLDVSDEVNRAVSGGSQLGEIHRSSDGSGGIKGENGSAGDENRTHEIQTIR
jgi:hypothetical protein